MKKPVATVAFLMMVVSCGPVLAAGVLPNHPIITEVYNNPDGNNDGPVGRLPGNLHQEFIEIYLPPASALAPTQNKDALNLTFYEVEGDASSTGTGLVNYRFDLPTFDLDPTNGMTPGALGRPPSGVVVLGWVDYVGDPPIDLAGTPTERVGLVNGGVVDTGGDYLFIAINGAHFGGTQNFPVVLAENRIDLPSEASSGVVQNGSGAYLLVNRDAVGYVELCDDQHAGECAAGADPALPNDAFGLSTTALLDGFAANDDSLFDVTQQPYDSPTGDDIDLETVLPLGGAFSLLVAQVPEQDDTRPAPGVASGYARVYPDVPKTTENESALDNDPVADATLAYRHVRNAGPYFPTPGSALLTTSPPQLGVATAAEQSFEVLSGTTGRPGLLCANVGGQFGIDLTATPATPSDPTVASVGAGTVAAGIGGQTFGFPTIVVAPTALAAHGDSATVELTVSAQNSVPTDPTVLDPVQVTTATVTVLDPVTGLNVIGQPFQTTVFLAVRPVPDAPAALNDFLETDLGAFVSVHLGGSARDALGHGAILTDPTLNTASGAVLYAGLNLVTAFPEVESDYINLPGAAGGLDLVQTVLQSAEVQSGSPAYSGSFNLFHTAIKAVAFNLPETRTDNGPFATSAVMHFADAGGFVGSPRSGLTHVTTSRTFELAILDTNVRQDSTVESGATDDFGALVQAGLTDPDAPVVSGEWIFLSFSGGLQGADIDTLEVPPGGNLANVIFLDLDNLKDHLGVRTIQTLVLIDGSGNGQVDVMEVFSLNPVQCAPADGDCDGDVDLLDYTQFQNCASGPGIPAAPACVLFDLDGDADIDLHDFGALMRLFNG